MDELCAPPPPDALPVLHDGDVRTVPAGELVARVHKLGGTHPSDWNSFRAWGPDRKARFDHHDPDRPREHNAVRGERCVWYGAVDATPRGPGQPAGDDRAALTALAEVFQSRRIIDRHTGDPWLALVAVARPLRLLYAESGWGARAGCGRLLGTGRKARARAWSRAIHCGYPELDGIVWASSVWPPGDAVVLYERARDAFPPHPRLASPLSHPGLDRWLGRAAEAFGDWPVV